MGMTFEGFSDAKGADAGFREATRDAVKKYNAQRASAGARAHDEPVRLRVADMYVSVQNPIHGWIVVLEGDA
jgi:hypothetical protein